MDGTPAHNIGERAARHAGGMALRRAAIGVLLVTAGALGATLLSRLSQPAGGRLPFSNAALAEMVGTSGSFTAMTTTTASQELLYVIDNRTEQFLIYEVRNAREVLLRRRQDLPALFVSARARAGG